jgi:mono/diheme cytochrome c family protein
VFRHHRISIALLILVSVLGCEGSKNNSSWSTAKPGDGIQPPLTTSFDQGKVASSSTAPATAPQTATTQTAAEGASSGRGVGPVDHVDVASLDAARAMKGAELFPVKCSACHKLDEKYIGPALAGVTKRRQPEWICNMILNPENMIQQDPTAKALLAQYIAPMANQHLTREEAESILAYFMQHDNAAKDDGDHKEVSEAGEHSESTSH